MSRVGEGIQKSVLDAHSILMAISDNTPVVLTVAASRILGRKSSGNIVALTAAELRTIIGVESGATADLSGDEIVALLEALAGAAQLSHSKISDVGATDHHTTAILNSLLTTRGDIIYRNATIPDRLAKGSNGQVLIMGADDPGWAIAEKVTFTALDGQENKKVTSTGAWEDWDISGIVPAGIIAVEVGLANSSSSTYYLGVRKNGTALNRLFQIIGATAVHKPRMSTTVEPDASRIVEIQAGNNDPNGPNFGVLGYWS